MSVRSAVARPDAAAPVGALAADAARIPDEGAGRRARAARRRQVQVLVLRVAFAVVWLGSWELTTRIGIVDKFFFGMPSGVVLRLWTCTTHRRFAGPVRGRLRFAMSPLGLVDLLAILPFYLPLLGAIDLNRMREANKRVDVDGRRPRAAGAELLEALRRGAARPVS